MKESGTLKLINLLKDGLWHSNIELNKSAGWRFGGKLFVLKKMGFVFEKKGNAKTDKDYIEYWRLVSSPMYEVVNGHIITNAGKIKRLIKQIERERPQTLWQKFIKLF